MIDNRILTFLKLCELGNYRKTAEALAMTQPAVTQHIHYLEEVYGCKLFEYKDRKLFKTPQCEMLEKHALAVVYNEGVFKREIGGYGVKKIAVGATKTIGEYIIGDKVMNLLGRENAELEVIIDNTKHLLSLLNGLKLDVLMLEGNFDKREYGHHLMKVENLVGICGKKHPFAGRKVGFSEIFAENIFLREEGSGTRGVLENFLAGKNHSVASFCGKCVLSSFSLITEGVARGLGVSFVYESVANACDSVAVFEISGEKIAHEFNYVYLKNANVAEILGIIEEA